MAKADRETVLGADELEDVCKKRSEEHQSIKANYEKWCADQQQKLQTETGKLEGELRQLKKSLADVELEDARAAEELGRLLSRPWMQQEGSPDIDDLFAEADRWNTELRRIRATRDRPGENKTAIQREIEKVQNKLEGLPAQYTLRRIRETLRVREQLEDLWQRQSQPGASTTNSSNDAARTYLTAASSLAAEGSMSVSSAPAHEQRHERSREASLETISSNEFRQSVFPQNPGLHSSPGQDPVQSDTSSPDPSSAPAPNTNRASGVPVVPQHKIPKPSSKASVIFRDRKGRYLAERATDGRKKHQESPQAYRNLGLVQGPAHSRFGRVNTSLLPNTHTGGKKSKRESTGSNHLGNIESRPNPARRAREDTDTFLVTSVQSARHEVLSPYGRKTTGKQATRRWSQISVPDSDSDQPIAKKQKTEKTILFDEVDAERKNWRQGEKIYRITEYPSALNRWYIFPCQKHCTGFLHAKGAARHLERGGHGSTRWTTPQAVEEIGVHVVDCDVEKANRNNAAYERATELGYRANQLCHKSDCPVHGRIGRPHRTFHPGQRPQSEGLEDSGSDSDEAPSEIPKGQGGDSRAHEVGQQPNPWLTDREFIPGEIYQAYWTSDHCWYPVTVLPWGDLREVGLVGSLDETDLFKERLPTCFAVEDSQDGLRIAGWKKDFELHHRRASERKFPCMFFEGISAIPTRDKEFSRPVQNLAWVMAKHLRPINYRHPGYHVFNEAGLDEAKAFRERVITLNRKATGEPTPFSRMSDDDDSDQADAREKSHTSHSMHFKGVKIEQDLDYRF